MRRIAHRLLEFFLALAQRLREDRGFETAGSLTFTTLLALVPLVAVALALATPFPAYEHAMAALWMIGVEDEPTQSAEICVFEVFGRDIRPDSSALVGMGVHPFRDPSITDDFERVPFAGDVREPHRYAVDWRPDEVVFSIDGVVAKRVAQSPQYPMQLMLDVFAFPPEPPARAAYPESFAVHAVRGYRLG